jgi:hypothetical protein
VWLPHFDTGSHLGDAERDAHPTLDELLARWRALDDAIARRLGELTEAELSAPPTARLPSPDGTLRGALAAVAFHEAYHLGQLGYVRRWLGYSPLFDG